MHFNRKTVILVLFAALCGTASSAAADTPGSGTAVIAPSTDVTAGTQGTWTLTYTAAEPFSSGLVKYTIPTGWTTPQNSSSTSAGYITATSDDPSAVLGISVAGQIVSVTTTVLATGKTISLLYGDTGGGANPTAKASAPTAPASGVTFLVESDSQSGNNPAPIASSPSVNIVAGSPFSLDLSPADTTATAGDFIRLTIASVDIYGNRTAVSATRTFLLSSAPSGQFFATSNHSTPITSTTITAGQESTLVDYRNTDANGGSSHLIIVLNTDILSPSLFGTTTITITSASASLTQSTIISTTPVTADGTSVSTATVTALDAYSNPVSGVTVTLSVGGSAVKTDPGSVTGSDGVAQGTLTDTAAESVWVKAKLDGAWLADSTQVVFAAGAVDAGTSVVSATSPVTADGASASVVTVTAKDAQGNVVSGKSVVLSVSPAVSGDILTQPGGLTDGSGQAFGSLLGVVSGTRVIHAVIGGVSVTDSALVVMDAGAAASFVWSHDGSGVAGVNEDVTLEVKDTQGNRVTGYTGAAYLTTTTGGTGDTVVEWALGAGAGGVLTNLSADSASYVFNASDQGLVSLRVKDERKEIITLKAQDGGAVGTSGSLDIDHGGADQLVLVSGNTQSAVVGTAVGSSLVVRVEDSYGNTVDLEDVTFTVLTGGGGVDVVSGAPVDSTAASGVDGTAVCEQWTLGTVSGTNTLRAHMAGGSVPSVDFSATGTAGTGVSITLTPASQGVTVNTNTTVVTAQLKDTYGNVVGGKRVDVLIGNVPANGTLEANSADANATYAVTSTARYGMTDTSGKITVLYHAPSTASQVDSVDAFGDGAVRSSVTDAVYTSVASGATNLEIVWVSSGSGPAGQTFTFKVRAVDGNGNLDGTNGSVVNLGADAGGVITFSETDFGSAVTQIILVNGEKVVYGRAEKTGTWNLSAVDNGGVLGSGSEQVVISDSGVVDHYIVTAVDSVVAGVSFNVTVEARDVYENRVTGATNNVALVAVNGADSLVVEADTLLVGSAALSGGQVVVGESYTAAGTIRVRARYGSLKEGYSSVVKIKPSGAYRLVKVSGDTTGVVTGGSVTLVSKVLDIYGNTVSGELVSYGVLSGGGSVSPGSSSSGSDGRVSVVHTTGLSAGDNQVRGTIGDGNPASLESVEYLVTTVASSIDHYTVTPVKTSVSAGEVMNVTVRAYDVNNNLVSGDNTTNVVLSSSTGHAVYGSAVGTLSAGEYTTTVTDTITESVVLLVQTQGGGASGSSSVVTVSSAAAYEVVKVSGDTTGVTVGTRRRMKVRVKDVYGNAVSGQVVIFSVVGVPGGTALIKDAVGDTTDGITNTDAGGMAYADVITSLQSGDNQVKSSILDGTPAALETKTFTVTTTAGAISYYTVIPQVSQAAAGVPVNITIKAFDASDNLVPDNSTLVILSMDMGSGSFPLNPATLTAGSLLTAVTDTIAETIKVRATTQGGSATGLSPPVVIIPNLPAGIITATATADTITANGLATTDLTSSIITDQYGNTVASGTMIRISTDRGVITTPDHDPSSPSTNEQITNGGATVSFQIRSGTVPGSAAASMSSVSGSASGSKNLFFAAVPTFACPSNPMPNSVVPGDSIAFKVFVQNTSSTAVYLSTSTTFDFNDGTDYFSASLAAPLFIGASSSDTLRFAKELISAALDPSTYQPIVNLRGTDIYAGAFDKACLLPSGSLLLSTVEIVSITANTVVSRGRTENIIVGVKNNSSLSASITSISLSIPFGSYSFGTPITIPAAANPGQTVYITVPVTIEPTSSLGSSTIDAQVTASVGGNTVIDNSLAPHLPIPQWTVQAAASLSYVAGSLNPGVVSTGQSHSFSVSITNNGTATVTLDTLSTKLWFNDGVDTVKASLQQTAAIAGSSTQSIAFKTAQISPAFATVSYDVNLHFEGVENGGAFTKDLKTSSGGDFLSVVSPAVLVYSAGTLNPSQVSKSTSVSFEAQVLNSGGANIVLNTDSTRFSFASGAYSTALDANFTTTIIPGTNTLNFMSGAIDTAINAQGYLPQLRIVGTENGIAFAKTLIVTDTMLVQNAPVINITAINNSPAGLKFTADQSKSVNIWMNVTNGGQATVQLDSARVRFILSGTDRTSDFSIVNPTGFSGGAVLGGGLTDSLLFVISDNTANSMHTGPFTIEGDLWVQDLNNSQHIHTNTDQGGKGGLIVESPTDLAVLSIIPSQGAVTAGQTRAFQIRMAVKNNGVSDAGILLDPAVTNLSFSQGTTWNWTVRPLLAGGDTTIVGGETDTVIFDFSQAGNIAAPVPVRIDGVVSGVELNSGRIDFDNTTDFGSGSILVQTQAVINITGVAVSQSHVTQGSGLDWTINVGLENTGDSDVDLVLPDSLGISFQDDLGGFILLKPVQVVSGGTLLAGGATETLSIIVDSTGSVAAPGLKTITISLDGVEVNSSRMVTGGGLGSVSVELPPSISYEAATLSPDTVSSGATVGFTLQVRNTVIGGSTVHVDRALSHLRFGGGLFDAVLDAASVDTVSAGQAALLRFIASEVDTNITPGSQNVFVDVVGSENGNVYSAPLALPAGELVVEAAPRLNILSIVPDQATVTQGQTQQWRARMVVENNGQAGVDLDLSALGSYLGFEAAGVGDVSGEYTVLQPAGLSIAGGTILPGTSVDTLVYRVTQTGTTLGTVLVTGRLSGTDVNSSQPVSDDTFDGGNGSISVQSPGVLEILSITPDQATVTAGQSQSWLAKVAVRNSGGSDLDIDLAGANLGFSGGGSGWTVINPISLNGTGSVLEGGSTDSLFFVIDSTGTAGSFRMDCGLASVELNSVRAVGDTTDTSGWGNILVQTPAVLSITQITASQPRITMGQAAPWIIYVTLANSGESDVILSFLTADTKLDFPEAVSPYVISQPVGSTFLPGDSTRTLAFNVSPTPSFAGAGWDSLTGKISGEHVNDKAQVSAGLIDSLYFEFSPNPVYIDTSLSPRIVSKGSNVGFSLDVVSGAGEATVALNSNTKFVISDQSGHVLQAALSPLSPDSLKPLVPAHLLFSQIPVDTAFVPGMYLPDVILEGSENGNQFLISIQTGLDSVSVQGASAVSIEKIIVSQNRVTTGQTYQWTAGMKVSNNGDAPVRLNSQGTYLDFNIFAAGDVSAEYTVVPDTVFSGSGTSLLNGHSSDTVFFAIDKTGSTRGPLTLHGIFLGKDINSQIDVGANTFSGGYATMVVENPGILNVGSIAPSQGAATRGQTADWHAVALVENLGEAAIKLSFNDSVPLIRAVHDSGFSWILPQATLSGDSILSAGEIDSVKFTADTTGSWTGLDTLHVRAEGIEENSRTSKSYDTETGGGGSGSILIQTEPDIVISSTAVVSNNSPQVNTSQTFKVAVDVSNTGEASAKDIVVSLLDSALRSTILPPSSKTIPFIPGGGASVSDTFFVRADTIPGADTLVGYVKRAVDANSSDTSLVVIGPNVQDSAYAQIQMPAALTIATLRTSQPRVTQQQTQHWYINVILGNSGEASLALAPPAAGDISFFIGMNQLIDYVVLPPDTFLSGKKSWLLAGGETDSLMYTVSTTGSDTGTVDIRSSLSAVDTNDLRTRADTGRTSIIVEKQSGLRIVSASADAPNKPQPDLAIVNTNQHFAINITVQNSGESVDSVSVRLLSDGLSLVVPPADSLRSIPRDSTSTYAFDITAAGLTNIQELFTSTITHAVSANSGNPVTPKPPVDNTEVVTIQKPADMNVGAGITGPAGAADDTLSTNQLFDITALVSNQGDAAVDNLGRITLALPAGFALEPLGQSADTSFVPSAPIVWHVKAPAAASAGPVPLVVWNSVKPLDINAGDSALVSIPRDTIMVIVLDQASLAVPALRITSPSGAVDNVLSTEQDFTVEVSIDANETAENIKAFLQFEPGSGFNAPDSTVARMGMGTGGTKTAKFKVTAPVDSTNGFENITVRFTSLDENSGDSTQSSMQALAVRVVPKALLSLSAWIDSPPEAQDSVVSFNLPFVIKARMMNDAARAHIDTTTAKPRLLISNFGSFTVSSSRRQAFGIGQDVSWDITAPPVSTPPVAIRIGIDNLPLDENSMTPATVAGGINAIIIPMQTEGTFVTAQNVTSEVGFETVTRPTSQGRRDIGLLAVELANPSASADAAVVKWIDVSVMNGNKQLVADPSRYLSEVYVELSSGARFDGTIGANQVRIDFGPSFTILAQQADTVSIYASVSPSAPEGKIFAAVPDTGAVRIVDQLSGAGMPLVDKNTEQPDLADKLWSRGLVLGSSNFNEYVRSYPNPFGAGWEVARITYFMDSPGAVSIRVYSLAGELVYEKSYSSGQPETLPGDHEAIWDGRNMMGDIVRNGIYICKIQAGKNSASVKIAVAK